MNDKKLMMVFMVTVAMLQFTISANAQEKGMEFFEGSWDAALAKSKETGKPIFVDVYTEWCGPCKMMAKEIFPLEQVGRKYNAAFINYKADAEKGDGIAIGKKYNVNAYPTYLYIRSDGELVHRSGGFSSDPGSFIAQADLAMEAAKDPYTISKMAADFKKGKKDRDFLKLYITKLNKLEMDNGAVLDAYLLQLNTAARLQPENYSFFLQKMNSSSSKTFEFVMQNLDKEKLKTVMGNGMMSYQLIGLLQKGLAEAMAAGKYERAATLIRYAARLKDLNGYDADFFAAQKLEYLDKTNKVAELLTATKAFVKEDALRTVAQIKKENRRRFDEFMEPYLTGKIDSTAENSFGKTKKYYSNQYMTAVASKLYVAAGHVNNKVKDKVELRKALAWSRKAEQLVPDQQEYRDLSAKLLKKINKK